MPQTEKQKEWISNNQDKVKEYQKKYHQKHKLTLAKVRSERYFKHKPKHQQLAKDYYAKNKDIIKAQKKQYYQDNKEIIKAHQIARYYKEKCAGLSMDIALKETGPIMKYVVKAFMVHQVYGVFDDGVPIEDIPTFHKQVEKTKQYCLTNDIIYKMWGKQEADELINKYPEYKKLYENFRFPIQKADFIRYLILYDQGGVYIDCDIAPIHDINHLFNTVFFVRWNDDTKQLPYNAVLGTTRDNPLYQDILQHIQTSYYEKSKMDIYDKWKGRFVFQTTGHYMLNRVLKKHKDIPKLDILTINSKNGTVIQGDAPLFEDFNVSYWFK
tara:strand:+ start:314 stop:1291 length:978 start_codon:yes stop_codon:yes gene_type:complete